PLTNADNGLLFHINLTNAIKRAKRNKKLLALIYIDLDKFKVVNDSFGHGVGDQVLVIVTEKIRKHIRETDLIARIGGDEFTVILEQLNEYENAAMVARRICDALAIPFKINNSIISISCSIGISFYPYDGVDAKMLVKAADEAMYYVKTHGGNNFYLNPEPLN
ncbi:MAG: diguanylate cyclase domain-containing protein, partial [Gammaproteobacteria bacterium]